MNTASVYVANGVRVPTSGLQIIGGPLSVSRVTTSTPVQFVEYAPASNQPQVASGSEQEYLWNTTPLTKSGLTWLSASNWSSVSASGGSSIFTPGANGLGLYFIMWAVSASVGGCEYFINRNTTAKTGSSTTTAYGTNNMKAVVTYPVSATATGGEVIVATILINNPTDFIAFGCYNNTQATITNNALNTVLSRTYLRIRKMSSINSASTLVANNFRVPASGLKISGGSLSTPALSIVSDLVEYAAAASQPSANNGTSQEYMWSTTPLTQNGFSWLTPSQWSYTSTTTGGGSIFTPGANGLGLYTVYWQVYWTNGTTEAFILKNQVATNNGIYGNNNMKALQGNYTKSQSLGQLCSAQILISAPTDYIAFGWYNGTGSATTPPFLSGRNYLRIVRQ